MTSRYFYGFILSFIFGVGLESLLSFGFPLALLFLFVGCILLLARQREVRDQKSFLVSLLLIACALGVFRVDLSAMKRWSDSLETLHDQAIALEGIVAKDPDVRDMYTNIVFDPSGVLEHAPRVLVRAPSYPKLAYGDRLRISGKLMTPKNFAGDGGVRTFDYRAYLANDGIAYQMFFPHIEIVTHNQGNIVLEQLFTFKQKLLANINTRIPEPEAALGGGILLGTKQSLGEALLEQFRITGVAHIVVLSGYNIAIIATALALLLIKLPFRTRIISGMLGVVLFACMVGGEATVMRATIMILVVLLARMLGRTSSALRGLVLAGGVMIAINPNILLHDVSFQLSFMATLALAVLVPLIEKYFAWIKDAVMREIVVATIATQIFVLPLILYYMGTISIIGLVANLLILPVVPFAMLCVALVALLASIPFVGSLCAALAYGVLWYVVGVVELLSRLPFAQVSGIPFPLWGLIFGYVVLGVAVFKNYFSISRTTSSLLR